MAAAHCYSEGPSQSSADHKADRHAYHNSGSVIRTASSRHGSSAIWDARWPFFLCDLRDLLLLSSFAFGVEPIEDLEFDRMLGDTLAEIPA